MPSKMKLRLAIVIGSIFLVAPVTAPSSQEVQHPVVWQNSRLSVQFENSTITQILNSVAQATGVKLTIDPTVSSYRESVSFKSLALKDGLLKVLEGSGMDYVLIGDPHSAEGVTQLLVLGFTPKGGGGSSGSISSFPSGAQGQLRSGDNVNVVPNPFSDRTEVQQVVPSRPADSGGFLPFPEAAAPPAEGTNAAPAQRAVPANPFNPDGSPAPGTNAPPPVRRIRRDTPPERKDQF